MDVQSIDVDHFQVRAISIGTGGRTHPPALPGIPPARVGGRRLHKIGVRRTAWRLSKMNWPRLAMRSAMLALGTEHGNPREQVEQAGA
jgi:hypothetical protein